jgi:hypothetical protein
MKNERRMSYLVEDQSQLICLQNLDASNEAQPCIQRDCPLWRLGPIEPKIDIISGPMGSQTSGRTYSSSTELLNNLTALPLHRPRMLGTFFSLPLIDCSLAYPVAGDMRLSSSVRTGHCFDQGYRSVRISSEMLLPNDTMKGAACEVTAAVPIGRETLSDHASARRRQTTARTRA